MSKYTEILKKYWGYDSFRSLQEDIICSVADEKKDTLGLLPTGGGKSIIFQVPAMASEGTCLVVTPLIALMKDQVENLKTRGIRAVAIYSGMTKREIDIALNNCVYGEVKFLYLSPERIATDVFKAKLQYLNINLIAIDEAHCISQWGYDFRPSYLRVAEIKEQLPDTPILALTATATPQVADDIQERLGFKEKNLFQKSFARGNLVYIVRKVEDKNKHLLKIANSFTGSGVVYVRIRKRTREIAELLQQNGITADYYHAGLSNELKDLKQDSWKKGQTRVMVSTNAFGMGIDKADVRFVVHMDTPDSVEAYFQEAGRGGRDEEQAFAVLLYNKEDRQKLERQLSSSFPPKDEIRRVYNALGNFFQVAVGAGKQRPFDFSLSNFASQYNLQITLIYNALKILHWCDYVEFTEEINAPSKVTFLLHRDQLYKLQVKSNQVDLLVKVLLRTYTGLFVDYVSIDEDFIAKKLNAKREQVIELIKKLRKAKVIDYIPQKKMPIVMFMTERMDSKLLRFPKEQYEERQARLKERIDAVLKYTESTEQCRSTLLLAYFGEENATACGQCDYCREKKKKPLTESAISEYRIQFKKLLLPKPLSTDELTRAIRLPDDKVITLLRIFMEEASVKRNEEGKFFVA